MDSISDLTNTHHDNYVNYARCKPWKQHWSDAWDKDDHKTIHLSRDKNILMKNILHTLSKWTDKGMLGIAVLPQNCGTCQYCAHQWRLPIQAACYIRAVHYRRWGHPWEISCVCWGAITPLPLVHTVCSLRLQLCLLPGFNPCICQAWETSHLKFVRGNIGEEVFTSWPPTQQPSVVPLVQIDCRYWYSSLVSSDARCPPFATHVLSESFQSFVLVIRERHTFSLYPSCHPAGQVPAAHSNS